MKRGVLGRGLGQVGFEHWVRRAICVLPAACALGGGELDVVGGDCGHDGWVGSCDVGEDVGWEVGGMRWHCEEELNEWG